MQPFWQREVVYMYRTTDHAYTCYKKWLCSLHNYCTLKRNIETICTMYTVKSKKMANKYCLQIHQIIIIGMANSIECQSTSHCTALIMSSLLSAFNLAGCTASLTRLQIRPCTILVRRKVRSLLSRLKLFSSLDVIG